VPPPPAAPEAEGAAAVADHERERMQRGATLRPRSISRLDLTDHIAVTGLGGRRARPEPRASPPPTRRPPATLMRSAGAESLGFVVIPRSAAGADSMVALGADSMAALDQASVDGPGSSSDEGNDTKSITSSIARLPYAAPRTPRRPFSASQATSDRLSATPRAAPLDAASPPSPRTPRAQSIIHPEPPALGSAVADSAQINHVTVSSPSQPTATAATTAIAIATVPASPGAGAQACSVDALATPRRSVGFAAAAPPTHSVHSGDAGWPGGQATFKETQEQPEDQACLWRDTAAGLCSPSCCGACAPFL
jgi:hypothetical protein